MNSTFIILFGFKMQQQENKNDSADFVCFYLV